MKSYRKILFLFFGLSLSFLCFAQDIKKADLAGTWYPASREELSSLLDKYLSALPSQKIEGKIIALIQPHAGLKYSGPVAAYGFSAVKDLGIKTVIIVGFTHRKQFEGVSVYTQGYFDTPLGPLSIDKELAEALIAQNQKIKFYPQAFDDENSIELQLPFIKKILPNALIVPIAIGGQDYATTQVLSEALYNVLKDRSSYLLIASTDMSHYLPYQEAVDKDRRTINVLKELSDSALLKEDLLSGSNTLCGLSAVSAVMSCAKKMGADSLAVLKYANSGDTAGDKTSVVGYVSAAIYTKPEDRAEISESRYEDKKERVKDMLTPAQRKKLLQIARETIAEYLATGKIKDFSENDPALLEEKGAFVTLHKKGELRGCIGNIIGKGPLYKTVRDMSIESAINDPRFSPLSKGEFKDVDIEISVLSKPERQLNYENIVMGKHGVIVKKGWQSGVFLPQVADETGWSREEFLSNLCAHKAGLSSDAWKDKDTELYTFTAEVFSENYFK